MDTWWLVFGITIVLLWYNMRNLQYKIKAMRLNEKTWEELKKKKGRQSWNLFMLELLKLKKQNE